MAKKQAISILFPEKENIEVKAMPDAAWHDLGLDSLCEKLTPRANERTIISGIMRSVTADADTARFRIGVFADILAFPKLRERMTELLSQVQFLNDYGSFRKDHDIRAGLWELLHRLSELDDYINCIESIREVLSEYDITSEGLLRLRDYIGMVYEESLFAELKKDIASLRADTEHLRSVTIGVNLNKSFEVDSIGIISVNDKEFKSSGILGNFADALAAKDGIRSGNEWNGSYRYHPVSNSGADLNADVLPFGAFLHPFIAPAILAGTLAQTPEKDATRYVTHYFDKDISAMLSNITRKLEQTLSKYVSLSIGSITALIPEFMYYIRWAEFIEGLKARGYAFCRPEVLESGGKLRMDGRGIYNLKLAALSECEAKDIVPNDLDFCDAHTLYLLTGANRGGKTTITQAVGLIYALAQGGIFVPGESFSFEPVDCIYTHYPADEDKTMDLGRLGEECRRFKEIYDACTGRSLLLLNETFSTTSFEEGYYIARDAVRALLKKNVRTIYNTHMHKLARETEAINAEVDQEVSRTETTKHTDGDITENGVTCSESDDEQAGTERGFVHAASLVAVSNDHERSFRICVMPPEGRSYAEDIAEKYGVTYELLTKSR